MSKVSPQVETTPAARATARLLRRVLRNVPRDSWDETEANELNGG